jgi:hypothetical protein
MLDLLLGWLGDLAGALASLGTLLVASLLISVGWGCGLGHAGLKQEMKERHR